MRSSANLYFKVTYGARPHITKNCNYIYKRFFVICGLLPASTFSNTVAQDRISRNLLYIIKNNLKVFILCNIYKEKQKRKKMDLSLVEQEELIAIKEKFERLKKSRKAAVLRCGAYMMIIPPIIELLQLVRGWRAQTPYRRINDHSCLWNLT